MQDALVRQFRSTAIASARRLGVWAGWAVLGAAQLGWGADEPGARALQQHRLLRQHQEEALQLRLQQQQRTTQAPPADARQKQAQEKLLIDQQQRQQALHYQQSIKASVAQSADDDGSHAVKVEMERFRAGQQSQQQVRQFERELQAGSGK